MIEYRLYVEIREDFESLEELNDYLSNIESSVEEGYFQVDVRKVRSTAFGLENGYSKDDLDAKD